MQLRPRICIDEEHEKKIYVRKCLRCDKKFKTTNPYYRLCPSCRKSVTESNWFEN